MTSPPQSNDPVGATQPVGVSRPSPTSPARPGQRDAQWALEGGGALVFAGDGPGAIRESLRRLKTALVQAAPSPQVILVTSPAPGDGKSSLALNLALTFAGDGETRTLLVDADLRKPGFSALLRPRPTSGITEIAAGADWRAAVTLLANPPLAILTGGAIPPDPVKIFSSSRIRALFAELRRSFDRIIVDTPPAIPFVDANVVGPLADGAVIIVRAGRTQQAAYLRALEVLSSVRIVGAVLNGVTPNLADRENYTDKYYYKYYRRRTPK